MTRQELRDQFYKETGTYPVVGVRQPYSKHIEWLEDKILANNKLICTCDNRKVDSAEFDICGNCGELLPEDYC